MSAEPEEEQPLGNIDQVGIELPGLKARLTPDGVDKLVNYGAKWFLMGITVLFITWKVFDCGEAPPPCVNCGAHGSKQQPPKEKQP